MIDIVSPTYREMLDAGLSQDKAGVIARNLAERVVLTQRESRRRAFEDFNEALRKMIKGLAGV